MYDLYMRYYFGSQVEYNTNELKNGLITNNLTVALLESVRLKHIPLFMLNIGKYFYIVETVKGGCKSFAVASFIYELDCKTDDIKKDDWRYFPKYEYELVKPVAIVSKIPVKNVYDALKKNKYVKIVKHSAFMKFISSHIPSQKYVMPDEEKEYFYHGSPVDIKDSYLKPMDDGHEKIPHVYVNKYKSASLKFSVKGLASTTIWSCLNEYVWFLEIYPKTFDAFKTSGYMYYVKPTSFVKEFYPSYTSTKKVEIVKRERIPNVYKEMKKQKNLVMIGLGEFRKFLTCC